MANPNPIPKIRCSCGNTLRRGASFCDSCGKAVAKTKKDNGSVFSIINKIFSGTAIVVSGVVSGTVLYAVYRVVSWIYWVI